MRLNGKHKTSFTAPHAPFSDPVTFLWRSEANQGGIKTLGTVSSTQEMMTMLSYVMVPSRGNNKDDAGSTAHFQWYAAAIVAIKDNTLKQIPLNSSM